MRPFSILQPPQFLIPNSSSEPNSVGAPYNGMPPALGDRSSWSLPLEQSAPSPVVTLLPYLLHHPHPLKTALLRPALLPSDPLHSLGQLVLAKVMAKHPPWCQVKALIAFR